MASDQITGPLFGAEFPTLEATEAVIERSGHSGRAFFDPTFEQGDPFWGPRTVAWHGAILHPLGDGRRMGPDIGEETKGRIRGASNLDPFPGTEA